MSARGKKQHSSRRTQRNRGVIGLVLAALSIIVLLLFVIRFAYIAGSGHVGQVDLTKKTQKKYRFDQVIKARRGTIYDANGNAVAEDSNVYTLYAVLDKNQVSTAGRPLYVKDKAKTATVLSKYLKISATEITKTLNQNQFQVEFGAAGRNLSLEIKQKITDEKLPGINFTETPSRLYPNGTFASHIVGLAQLKTTVDQTNQQSTQQLKGLMGVEQYFNKQLTGVNGRQVAKLNNYGYELPDSKRVVKKAEDGSDVYLTLDSRLQSYLEQLLQDVQDKYDPTELSAILMNAKTGAIIAASQRPTFNAATKSGLETQWRDSLVEDAYEPGSVFKVLLLAAAIDSGKYNPNATYRSGSVTINGSTIRDWNQVGWGTIPFSQVIPRSSNTGAVHIEQALGETLWKEYLNRFRVGQKTGITLPNEASGSIQIKTPLDRAITSFGQAVNVSAVQMMSFLSAIANQGEMLQPRIVSKVVSNQGKVTKYDKKVLGTPISADTAKQVIAAMRQVVEADYGTGQQYKIDGYDQQIAVKTGTAQIASSKGGYLTGSNDYIYSVAGIAPADDPEYILYVTAKQPDITKADAISILSEIFNPLMKRALNYRTTSADTDANSIKMSKLTGLASAAAVKKAKDQGLTVTQVGNGSKIVQQLPAAGEKVIAKQRVVLLTEGAMTMPNVVGWSKNDVLKLAEITGGDFKFSGDGYVTSQSLKAGAVITAGQQIVIKLAEP
ncbi:penicillin-binding protein [Lapidilactobacillus achengensis]|uniref:Penicillin-binding protein n=1 Tax=Lapidilactobacillus achengensis TaxID=2486000 RepID=A0ABW1UTC6_9LACO|nr:penicillin-binding protein [Lapidilactobacillus achengensis]